MLLKQVFSLSLIVSLFIVSGCFESKDSHPDAVYLGATLGVGNITDQVSKAKKHYKPEPTLYSLMVFWDELFPDNIASHVLKRGGILNVQWTPQLQDAFEEFSLPEINEGVWDDHLFSWAKAVREYEYPVFITFAPDFNQRASGHFSLRDPIKQKEEFIAAYRYIVDLFREEDAHNAIWVWQFNVDEATFPMVVTKHLYPGGNYIDWMGVSSQVSENASVDVMYSHVLDNFQEDIPTKPIMWTLHQKVPLPNGVDSVKRTLSFVDQKNTKIRGLIFDFYDSYCYNTLKTPLKGSKFRSERDKLQNTLTR